MAKPSPKVIKTVCSECGLSWDDHTKGRKTAPTLDVCVRLLKVELAKPKAAPMPYYQPVISGTGIRPGGGGRTFPGWLNT